VKKRAAASPVGHFSIVIFTPAFLDSAPIVNQEAKCGEVKSYLGAHYLLQMFSCNTGKGRFCADNSLAWPYVCILVRCVYNLTISEREPFHRKKQLMSYSLPHQELNAKTINRL
jgi:hypothetical protein